MFAQAGFDDIAIAYPVSARRSGARVAELAAHARITVNVDSADGREGPQRRGRRRRRHDLGVQIDIDSGFGRCGVPIGRPRRDRGASRG